MDSAAVAERIAREAYGRLVAILAAPTRDIAAAEDALSEAFVSALRTWPARGIPVNPEGWLLTVARNRLKDLYKSAAYANVELNDVPTLTDETDMEAIPDKRLALLFTCAHPAIDPAIRTPLMLQTVLGFEAEQIARAFAVPAPAMAQRLVRAKRRIRDARIRFEVPDRSEMSIRLPPVLEAIYGAYAIDRHHEEALYLALLLARLVDDPEALGLAALLSFSLSRERARPTPLDEQDVTLWDTALIDEGERLLNRAAALGLVGRFQLEAAIESAHCARARTGSTDRLALLTLHRGLVALAPTLGSTVALTAAVAEVDGPLAGLVALDAIDGAAEFQPAWAVRAHLLAASGATDAASAAYDEAIRLSADPVDRELLGARRAHLR